MPNRIAFGLPGHEHEFVINFAEYSGFSLSWEYIPGYYARCIENTLKPYYFDVCNRGTRIEILPPVEMWNDMRPGDFEFVFDTIKKLFPTKDFVTEIHYNGKVEKCQIQNTPSKSE